jgi:hypothetical protein
MTLIPHRGWWQRRWVYDKNWFSAAFHQAQQRFLNAGFRAGIYAGSGLIQNEDTRISEDGAGIECS